LGRSRQSRRSEKDPAENEVGGHAAAKRAVKKIYEARRRYNGESAGCHRRNNIHDVNPHSIGNNVVRANVNSEAGDDPTGHADFDTNLSGVGVSRCITTARTGAPPGWNSGPERNDRGTDNSNARQTAHCC